jgi:hypothetical protein
MSERLLEIGSALDSVVACKILDLQLGQVHERGGRAEVLTFTLDDGSVLRITSSGNDGWEFWFTIDHEHG